MNTALALASVALLASGTVLVSRAADPTDPDVEPGAIYGLTVGKETFQVTGGQPVKLKIGGKEVLVSIEAPTTRRFEKKGVTFDYPAGFSFEYESYGPGSHNWTLDSLDATLTVFVGWGLTGQESVDAMLEGLVEVFESMNAEIEQSEIERGFEGGLVEGLEVLVTIPELGELNHEIYGFDGAEGGVALIFADNRDEDGVATESFEALCEMVEATLAVDSGGK